MDGQRKFFADNDKERRLIDEIIKLRRKVYDKGQSRQYVTTGDEGQDDQYVTLYDEGEVEQEEVQVEGDGDEVFYNDTDAELNVDNYFSDCDIVFLSRVIDFDMYAIVDTGCTRSCMSQQTLDKILKSRPPTHYKMLNKRANFRFGLSKTYDTCRAIQILSLEGRISRFLFSL